VTPPAVQAWMLVPASRERFDGIRDFARHLASALSPAQQVLTITTRDDAEPAKGARVLEAWSDLRAAGARPDVVYVNYIPTAWLQIGTLRVLRTLASLAARGTRVVIIVHEYQLDSTGSARRTAARVLFRTLARAFAKRAHALVATHGFVAGLLRDDGLDRYARIVVIPAGSNIDPPDRDRPRRFEPEGGAVVMFGQPAGMDAELVAAVAAALAPSGASPLQWICRDGAETQRWLTTAGVPEGRVAIRAGLGAAEVAAAMSAAALSFAPMLDGVSTRRTTVVTFVQHGLPVAGTLGRATDDVLIASGAFEVLPRGSAAAMAALVIALLGDAQERERMSAAARRLFDAHLAWPRIASRYLELSTD
jgi:glycosyltransferase involved in cell wall biosynthesis